MDRRISAVCAALALSACATDAPTSAASVDALANARVVSIASGDGTGQLPPGFSPLTFSLSAKALADGSAMGHFSFHHASASGSTEFEGTVTCVSFDPALGRAWIGGVITANRSTHPALQSPIHQVGRDAWFRVVDNGEGENAADDRTTVLGFEGGAGILTSAQYCAAQLWTPGDVNTWAVIAGNIQVKP